MRFPIPARTLARLALVVTVAWAAAAGVASAQTAPQAPTTTPATPGQGYADPEGVPARPPAIDVEPVWAKPAIDTLATVRKRGTLRVGVVPNEPFVMRDAEGELTGFSIDLGRQLATDIGVRVEFVPTSWSQVVPDLLGNHFDVIAAGLWITPARALVVNFSSPTALGAMYLVANRTLAATMKSRPDFDRPDVRIVVYAGTSQEGVASRLFPKATLVKIEGDADPLAPVLEGKAHALVVTTPSPQLVVDHSPDRLVLPFEEPLETSTAALAIRKGDSDFLNYLNSWLAFHREDGWLPDRYNYWFERTAWIKGM